MLRQGMIAFALAAWLAPAASASTASLTYENIVEKDPTSGTPVVHVTGAPGEANVIEAHEEGGRLHITDAGAALTTADPDSRGCTSDPAGGVSCPNVGLEI